MTDTPTDRTSGWSLGPGPARQPARPGLAWKAFL